MHLFKIDQFFECILGYGNCIFLNKYFFISAELIEFSQHGAAHCRFVIPVARRKSSASGNMEHLKTPVKTIVFQAMQNADVKALAQCPEKDLRAVLPCLVRMALCASVDTSEVWTKSRKHVLKILSGIEIVNNIVALLSIDFHALEQDVKKEQQLRYDSRSLPLHEWVGMHLC